MFLNYAGGLFTKQQNIGKVEEMEESKETESLEENKWSLHLIMI